MSNASLVGTPPQSTNTAFRPSRTHSEASPQKHCASETLEKGKVATRQWTSRTTPSTLKSQAPKSTWASPGAHSKFKNSPFTDLISAFLAFTYFCTVV